jgi:hypothetical protein
MIVGNKVYYVLFKRRHNDASPFAIHLSFFLASLMAPPVAVRQFVPSHAGIIDMNNKAAPDPMPREQPQA